MLKDKKLYYFVLAAIMSLCVIISASVLFSAAQSVISWGVTPNSKEQTPQVPSGAAELLKNNNGLYVANTDEKKIYLTFDLGYEAGYTEQVLDILKEHNIKAVFFLCGNYLKERALIERMISEGHAIGNHTDKHKDLPSLSSDALKADIMDFSTKFNEQYGQTQIRFFRPPQGRFDERTLKAASEQGMKTMLWSIAIVDWNRKEMDAAGAKDKILKRVHSGAILLSHITNAGTPKMLKILIPAVLEKGYTIGSPDEL